MNQKKAKALRQEARRRTTNFNKPRYPVSLWGVNTFIHPTGTYRRIYRDAKRYYRQGVAV